MTSHSAYLSQYKTSYVLPTVDIVTVLAFQNVR